MTGKPSAADRMLAWTAAHAHRIPEPLLRGGFVLAADAAWLLRVPGVRQLERNLAQVTGRGGRALRRLSHAGMRSYFTYFAEAMTVGAAAASPRGEARLKARIRGGGDGLDSLIALTRAGSGGSGDSSGSAPIAMGHQGNWDYAAFWARDAVAPVTTVAERLGDEELLRTFVRFRQRLGMRILLTGESGLVQQLERALNEPPAIVPLLADRDLGRRGVFVHAFGSAMRVAAGPAVLALDTGKPLYVVAMHRERLHGRRRRTAGTRYGYVCEVSGPIDPAPYRAMTGRDNAGRERAVRELTQAWVDVWARGVAAHPEDWHMLQPIFLHDLDADRLRNVPDWVRDLQARTVPEPGKTTHQNRTPWRKVTR